MSAPATHAERIRHLVEGYGDGSDGSAPTPEQWRRLLERGDEGSPTLLNFFALRERARYPEGESASDVSGSEAFARYGEVSAPALEAVGGRFLLVAPSPSALVGTDEVWDLVVLGTYPNAAAVVALFENPSYREAYRHRRAACERQKVFVLG